jgi:hypothetical protein
MAFGSAFGQNMAFGPAFGHNAAFGPAFGHNKLLIMAFSHSKLIKLIGHAGHTSSLINSIGCIGPKIQTQLIVKLSPATNSGGTQVPSSKLTVGYHNSKYHFISAMIAEYFVREYRVMALALLRSTRQE